MEEALSLESRLWAHARRAPNGEIVWPNPVHGAGGEAVRLRPHLYDGVAGVALFLAAVAYLTEPEERREHILACLAPLRRELRQLADGQGTARALPLTLGALTGLGAYIYSFLLMSRWLAEPQLLEEAADLSALITLETIAADERLDVMSGSAGALLALLVLDRMAPDARREGVAPLERALACGEHLLDRRAGPQGQPRAWPAQGRPLSCGFVHGATGIACALAGLAARTGEARFLEAAEEAVAFERLHYSPEHGNWLFSSDGSEPRFVSGWCSGAPGIALGRLAMLPLLDGPEDREEIAGALRTTMAPSDAPLDFLCCGEMGKAEVLLYAHQVLGEEGFRTAADGIASQVVSRSRDQGGQYRFFPPGDDRFNLSFFKGAAGIGYTLLRLARPGLLPCVLRLEWNGTA
ncbi:MAG: lanthionine synthetase LanC family protein [Thermoanaerobaculia bacterium]